jgi:hypothetical protein
MARYGVSPARGRTTDYQPAQVTVCVLTHIPDAEGYYRDRMDVLRVCLESIRANTRVPYDLMVFDNASSAEVIDYLRGLHDSGAIDLLLLSSRNLGKIGALQVMFNAAPGEWIAYADDDILFYPGWLEAHLKIANTFPQVGMVSGAPVRDAARHAMRSNQAFIANSPEGVKVSQSHWIPDEWERDWALSTGRDAEKHLADTASHLDGMWEVHGVRAYPAANHYQYLARREVLLKAMPKTWTGKLMGHMVELDEAVDAQGVLRLSTIQRYTRHIGNVVSPALAEEVSQMGIQVEGKIVSRRPKRHWILNIPRMRPLLEKIYSKLYEILYHVKR